MAANDDFDRYRRELLSPDTVDATARRAGAPDDADPWRLARLVLRRTGSTNRLARRVVEEYLKDFTAPPPVLLVAWEQTGGRGRRGRSWSSPPGRGVWASRVVTLDTAERLELLPLATAVALAEAADELVGAGRCRLKWPNDLVAEGGKLGGILIEAVGRGEEPPVAVVGFGLNHGPVAGEVEESGPSPAGAGLSPTSLAELSDGDGTEPPDLTTAARQVIDGVERELERLADPERDGELVGRWRERLVQRPGDRVRCRLAGEQIEGTVTGFDERGRLLLDTADGSSRRLATGDLIETVPRDADETDAAETDADETEEPSP